MTGRSTDELLAEVRAERWRVMANVRRRHDDDLVKRPHRHDDTVVDRILRAAALLFILVLFSATAASLAIFATGQH